VSGVRTLARGVADRVRAARRTPRASEGRRPTAPDLAGPRLLAAYATVAPHARFVEVGANDGEQHDFLRPHARAGWTGVMVEPVPYIHARLQRNYAGVPGVALVNAAVADRNGTLPFFHLVEVADPRAEGLPDWYDGVGSFSRATVLSHADAIPDVAERLVETEVPCLTFDALCEAHGLARVDVLVVDTEGYDHEVLRTVDFARWRPRLVIYEHFHLDEQARGPAARSSKRGLRDARGGLRHALRPARSPATRSTAPGRPRGPPRPASPATSSAREAPPRGPGPPPRAGAARSPRRSSR
jgi:FkbM family methyltransferase